MNTAVDPAPTERRGVAKPATGFINAWGNPRRRPLRNPQEQPLRKGTRTENTDKIHDEFTMPRSLIILRK